jgi:flagellar motor switch protein FliG
MTLQVLQTPPTRKAAMVLLQLGKERAARILSKLDDVEVEEIAAEIMRMDRVDQDMADAVIEEFFEFSSLGPGIGGGESLIQEMLEATMGGEKAADLLERLRASMAGMPFDFIQQADGRQVLSLLAGEHPQTVALVLVHLRPDRASQIMSGLPPTVQADVALRIARMEKASPVSLSVVQVVAENLTRRASAVLGPQESAAAGGVDPLVAIINRADGGTERAIMDGLTELDNELADEVRSRMFIFTDILLLEDRAMQLVLRGVETGVLAMALKGASDEVRQKVLVNLSERARENLVDEIDVLGSVRMSQVEEARTAIVQDIRKLEQTGELTIRREGEDDYVS